MAGKAVIDALAQGTPPEQESKWQKIAKYLINDSIPAQAVKSAWSGFTLPGDVLAGKADPFDYGRALDFAGGVTLGSAAIPAKAGEMRMGAKMIGAADDAANDATKVGIRAFHGSPHDFDKFDISKIGTGEGGQAYGHGLYFADIEDVARGYRDRLTSHSPDSGTMYEVNINANPDDFLDWDAPIADQSYNVREALSHIFRPDQQGSSAATNMGLIAVRKDGLPATEAQRLAAEELKKIGIPGIKYFDAGSRSTGYGTRNYVVFDDALVSIVKKYGISGALAAGLLTQQQADEFWAQGT